MAVWARSSIQVVVFTVQTVQTVPCLLSCTLHTDPSSSGADTWTCSDNIVSTITNQLYLNPWQDIISPPPRTSDVVTCHPRPWPTLNRCCQDQRCHPVTFSTTPTRPPSLTTNTSTTTSLPSDPPTASAHPQVSSSNSSLLSAMTAYSHNMKAWSHQICRTLFQGILACSRDCRGSSVPVWADLQHPRRRTSRMTQKWTWNTRSSGLSSTSTGPRWWSPSPAGQCS